MDRPPSNTPTLSLVEIQDLIEGRRMECLSHHGGIEGLAKSLRVDLITGNKGRDWKDVYGKNILPERKSPTILKLMWLAYKDRTLILLTFAAVVSLLVGIYQELVMKEQGWIEGVAIICAICVVVLANAANDYQREKQFRMLSSKLKERMVTILSEGRPLLISVFEVSVGDIFLFEPGEVLPADGLLIEGHKVTIDESSITGESDAAQKNPETDPWLLSGTRVIDGSGRMLVLAVGVNSSQGQLASAMNVENSPTPLQRKLDVLADQIARAGVAAAIFMILSLLGKYFIIHWLRASWPEPAEIMQHLLHIIIQAVTVIVVAVPEGLPMAVTVALAFATTKMLKDNNLVRVIASCETMGAATTICSDKTGTLTENKMTVVKFNLCGIAGDLNTPPIDVDDRIIQLVTDGIAINSTAFMSTNGWIGSKTEVALLNFSIFLLSKADYFEIRKGSRVIQRVPFSSERKYMVTAVEDFDNEGRPIGRIFLKGAAEIVLSRCALCLKGDGSIGELNTNIKSDILRTIDLYAKESLRTIAMAAKDIADTDEFIKVSNSPDVLSQQEQYIWLGVVGIEDPLREGVKEAVQTCQDAGIVVRMVTGDNLETARAIATKANILKEDGLVMEGETFRQLKEHEWGEIIPKLRVLARSSPMDKQILVKKLRGSGEIVAVTGDGTNDGPALKAADVGFSMGIAGTEVAKEASSIVLMDDNFASIVKAVSWGRAVNQSVRKFLQFQLTVNVTAVVTAAVSAIIDSSDESVLTAVQLLWVNLIMDRYPLEANYFIASPLSHSPLMRHQTIY